MPKLAASSSSSSQSVSNEKNYIYLHIPRTNTRTVDFLRGEFQPPTVAYHFAIQVERRLLTVLRLAADWCIPRSHSCSIVVVVIRSSRPFPDGGSVLVSVPAGGHPDPRDPRKDRARRDYSCRDAAGDCGGKVAAQDAVSVTKKRRPTIGVHNFAKKVPINRQFKFLFY